jgi:hypothetical protein
VKRSAAAWLLCASALSALPMTSRAPRAHAADLDSAELERLESEGRAWFDKAGNTDASRDQRNEALREAYTRLKQAWSILDAYCDEHPAEIDALDEQMGRINKMLFWVKKEAPIGVLDGRKPGAASSSAPPTSSPGATAPAPPSATAPATAAPISAFERARAHQAARPGDLSGALALWLDVLASSTEPASPEHAEALSRVADLNERLKEAYRQMRDDDPDSIQVEHEPGQEGVVAARLVALLASEDPAARRRSVPIVNSDL